jgi:hypothetical protein
LPSTENLPDQTSQSAYLIHAGKCTLHARVGHDPRKHCRVHASTASRPWRTAAVLAEQPRQPSEAAAARFRHRDKAALELIGGVFQHPSHLYAAAGGAGMTMRIAEGDGDRLILWAARANKLRNI